MSSNYREADSRPAGIPEQKEEPKYYPNEREIAVIQAINALIDRPELYSEAKDPWGKVYADNVAAKIRQNAGQTGPVQPQKRNSLFST